MEFKNLEIALRIVSATNSFISDLKHLNLIRYDFSTGRRIVPEIKIVLEKEEINKIKWR